MIKTVNQVILAEEGVELITLVNAHGSSYVVAVPVTRSLDQRVQDIAQAKDILQRLEDAVEQRSRETGATVQKKVIVPAGVTARSPAG